MSKTQSKTIQESKAFIELTQTINELFEGDVNSQAIEDDLFKLLNAFVCTSDDEMLVRNERSNVLYTYKMVISLVRKSEQMRVLVS